MKSQNVLLYSGGLDSFLTYQYLCANRIPVDLLYFDSGAKCCDAEKELFESELFQSYIGEVEIRKELNFSNIERRDAYIPNRNIIAAICAQGINDYDNIYLGSSASDRVNDNNQCVFSKISDLLSFVHKREIKIQSPFFNIHKVELFNKFMTDRWDSFNFMKCFDTPLNKKIECDQIIPQLIFSCYSPRNVGDEREITVIGPKGKKFSYKTRECGCCPACLRKNISMFPWFKIPMFDHCSIVYMLSKYYNEAKTALNMIDISKNALSMKPRFEATIAYIDYIRKNYDI